VPAVTVAPEQSYWEWLFDGVFGGSFAGDTELERVTTAFYYDQFWQQQNFNSWTVETYMDLAQSTAAYNNILDNEALYAAARALATGSAVSGVGGGKGSAGSIWGSTENLMNAAKTQGNGGVTPVGRAFQKHAGDPSRAGTFSGEVTGNAAKNTQQGTQYLNDILGNPDSAFTVRNTKAYGDVLDVRLPDGTGARWSADGNTFIGFLERYTK
jgi:hypothetical protein